MIVLVAISLPQFLNWYYSISTENFLDEYDFIIGKRLKEFNYALLIIFIVCVGWGLEM